MKYENEFVMSSNICTWLKTLHNIGEHMMKYKSDLSYLTPTPLSFSRELLLTPLALFFVYVSFS